MKRSLLLVIALLAIASIMAAMALTRADISNAMKLSIVRTDKAEVGIIPNTEDHPGIAKFSDEKMFLDFNPGMQRNSNYSYDKLFTIKNNGERAIYVGLRFANCYEGNSTNYPVGLRSIVSSKKILKELDRPQDQWAPVNSLIFGSGGEKFTSGWNEGRMVRLEKDEEVDVSFNFSNGSLAGLVNNKGFTLEVHAKVATD